MKQARKQESKRAGKQESKQARKQESKKVNKPESKKARKEESKKTTKQESKKVKQQESKESKKVRKIEIQQGDSRSCFNNVGARSKLRTCKASVSQFEVFQAGQAIVGRDVGLQDPAHLQSHAKDAATSYLRV